MSEQTIKIEVDGRELETSPGRMLIDVTDENGIPIPRFCYHKKLSVAANCRMCLVEVEMGGRPVPKPLPACATAVADGMKVFTKSKLAREAQQGTMEFLLINHPLDCPICDQGGECELQDVSMGFGGDVSRFTERKRVVRDKDIGPLIATEMTRCIHCTRCVRFGGEIAGLREMGATGRGEHMEIGTYIEKSVGSELSGNVIDLCPVGALTAKPSRYQARAWELTEHQTVSPHDAVGANLSVHVRRGQVMRAVPRENEAVNETWIADRDRYSYQGLYSDDRLTKPMLRNAQGKLMEVSWQQALDAAGQALKGAGAELNTLVSLSATLEEQFLAAKLTRGLGSENIDSRLRQVDFRQAEPKLPWLGQSFSDLEKNNAVLLVGSWLRKDQPLLNHRVRKSTLEGGQVMAINPGDFDFNYELSQSISVAPSGMVAALAGVAKALGADIGDLEASSDVDGKGIADALKGADKGLVLLGNLANSHPDFSILRTLAARVAKAADVDLGFVSEGGNTVGAQLAGAVSSGGRTVSDILASEGGVTLLVNIEPEHDFADPQAAKNHLAKAGKVVAMSSYLSPWLQEHADVLLPSAVFTETSGTFVNGQCQAQTFTGVTAPAGEARPGWKILRVLGNTTEVDGFDYISSEQVRDQALAEGEITGDNDCGNTELNSVSLQANGGLERVAGSNIYAVDATVRRAEALHASADAWQGTVEINPEQADKDSIQDGAKVRISQGEGQLEVIAKFSARVPMGCVQLPSGVPGSELLAGFGPVSLEVVS